MQQIVLKRYKILGLIWLLAAVATILSSPFFISTEEMTEIVSSVGTLTETITNLLTFLTGCYLGVRQFHYIKGSTVPSAASSFSI